MTNFNTPAPVASTFARQTAKKPAPWVETGFVQVPREFFAIMHELSKGAKDVYLGHLANALSQGPSAGVSCQYRESYAEKWHCSETKLDRANTELEARGMIVKLPRRRHNAQPWGLLPPSKWQFDFFKTAPQKPQSRHLKEAKPRPITRDREEESFKTNSASAAASPVSVPVVENSFPSVSASSESEELTPLALELFRAGVNREVCESLAASAERAREVLDYVARPENSGLGGGWIRRAILEPNSVKMTCKAPASAQNGGAYSDFRATDHVAAKITEKIRPESMQVAPEVLERRAKAAADVAACLALMHPTKREGYELGMIGFSVRRQVEYLQGSAPAEWADATRRH